VHKAALKTGIRSGDPAELEVDGRRTRRAGADVIVKLVN